MLSHTLKRKVGKHLPLLSEKALFSHQSRSFFIQGKLNSRIFYSSLAAQRRYFSTETQKDEEIVIDPNAEPEPILSNK